MRALRRAIAIGIACSFAILLSQPALAQQSDEILAAQVLGPQWRQLSRRAGMIFAGTVLAADKALSRNQPVGATAAVELKFRVDEAIAGVDAGQILHVREWAGAQDMHPPVRPGEHLLLFLYPLSRLGLTSPVGGAMGQVELDASGHYVSDHARQPFVARIRQDPSSKPSQMSVSKIGIEQLGRAIRAARQK